MPETTLAEAIKKQIRELEKLRKQNEDAAERTAAMIAELQKQVKAYDKKRRS